MTKLLQPEERTRAMPFTANDLSKAIHNRNVGKVVKILRDTNAQGIPKVDINSNIRPDEGGMATTALLDAMARNRYAFKPFTEANFQIIQAILAVRDTQNNPVIDINRKSTPFLGRIGCSALFDAFSLQYSGIHGVYSFDQNNAAHIQNRQISRRLVEMFLDLRDAQGRQVYDLSSENPEAILKAAIDTNDPQIVRHLLDWRSADGQRLISVNQVLRIEGVSLTPIEYANQVHGPFNKIPASPEIVAILRELGGRAFNGLRRQIQPQNNPAPLAQQNANNNINADNAFERDAQNTHNTAITISVNSSIKNLRTRYPISETNKINALKAIREHIAALPNSPQKTTVIACLNRIERDATIRSVIDATLSDVLALVWYGILDKEAPPSDLKEIDDNYVKLRKESLIEKLYQAQTTYGNLPSCFVGTLNKITETLNHAHPDVFLVFGNENILTSATDFSLEFSKAYFLSELKKKPLKKQRKILHTWLDDEEENKQIDSPSQLRAAAAKACKEKLKNTFGILLTEKQRDEITSQFEYLPRPIIHENLNKIVTRISKIPNDINNEDRNMVIGKLKKYAENAYAETDRTFEEEYAFLDAEEKLMNTFGILLTETQHNEITSQFEDLPRPIIHENLNKIVTRISEMPNDINNEDRNTITGKLKKYAENAYTETNRTPDEEYAFLDTEEKHYNKLIVLLSKINNIKERKNDADYQARLTLLKQNTAMTCSNNGASLKESYTALNELLFNFETADLYNAINKMKTYGQDLQKSGAVKKGKVAEDLATDLDKKAREFFIPNKSITREDFQNFSSTFMQSLSSKNTEMSQYRTAWGTILKNTAIALTGVGLLFIAGKLIYSKISDDRALFFFQKKKTSGEDKTEAIKDSLKNYSLTIAG